MRDDIALSSNTHMCTRTHDVRLFQNEEPYFQVAFSIPSSIDFHVTNRKHAFHAMNINVTQYMIISCMSVVVVVVFFFFFRSINCSYVCYYCCCNE